MKIASFTKIALFSALMSASVYLIPPFQLPLIPVSFTLQTFFVVLAGYLLMPAEAFLAILVYLALGAMGLPVYSGGQAGIQTLLGPTGGFLVLFPFVALLIAIGKKWTKSIVSRLALGIVVEIILLYPLAVIWLSLYLETPYWALLWTMVPYAAFDLLKIVLAQGIAQRIRTITASNN